MGLPDGDRVTVGCARSRRVHKNYVMCADALDVAESGAIKSFPLHSTLTSCCAEGFPALLTGVFVARSHKTAIDCYGWYLAGFQKTLTFVSSHASIKWV